MDRDIEEACRMAKEVTDQTFEQEILQHQGVALVDFWAPWWVLAG